MRKIYVILSLMFVSAISSVHAQSFSNKLSGTPQNHKAETQTTQSLAETKATPANNSKKQTASKAKANSSGMKRDVLYTLAPDEIICTGECFLNFKTQGSKYALITSIDDKYFLNVNGDKVEVWSAYQPWIDLNSLANCIYIQAPRYHEKYIVINGEKYGPYDDIDFRRNASYSDKIIDLDYWYKHNSFVYYKNGHWFRHDNDGAVYPLPYPSALSPIYKNKSGSHVAMIPNANKPHIIFDEENYDLTPFIGNEEDRPISDVYVTDNGICIVKHYNRDNREAEYLLLKDGMFRKLNKDEYFDPNTLSVCKYNYEEENFAIRCTDSDDDFLECMNLDLYDTSGNHHLQSLWDKDYVTIDGKQYNTPAPLSAFYDRDSNSFGWVSLDGNELVLYSVQL